MKSFTICTLLSLTVLFACKKQNDEQYPLIKDKLMKSNLIRYQHYEDNYFAAIKSHQLDLRRIYSDSTNFYDSIIHARTSEMNESEFHYFKQLIDSLKSRRIEALKKANVEQ